MGHRSSNTKGYTHNAFLMFLILHSLAFVIHLISTIYAFGFIPSEEWKVYSNLTIETNVLKLDVHSKLILEKNNIDFVIDTGPSDNIVRQTFDNVNPIRLIAYNELITTLSHFIAIFLLYLSQYENVGQCISGIFKCRHYRQSLEEPEESPIYYPRPAEYNRRWVEYSITAGLLEVALAVSVGHDNIYVLFSLIVLNVVQQMCGFLLDDLKYQDDMSSHYIVEGDNDNFIWLQPARNMIFLFGAGFLILSAQIFIVLGGAINLDVGDNDWFFPLAIVYSIVYSLFGIHLLIIHIFDYCVGSDDNGYLKYFDGDAIFVVLSCSVKVLLSWVCITSIYEIFIEKGGENYITGTNEITDVVWKDVRNNIIIFSSLLFFFGILFVSLMTDSSYCGKVCARNCCKRRIKIRRIK